MCCVVCTGLWQCITKPYFGLHRELCCKCSQRICVAAEARSLSIIQSEHGLRDNLLADVIDQRLGSSHICFWIFFILRIFSSLHSPKIRLMRGGRAEMTAKRVASSGLYYQSRTWCTSRHFALKFRGSSISLPLSSTAIPQSWYIWSVGEAISVARTRKTSRNVQDFTLHWPSLWNGPLLQCRTVKAL